MFISLQDVTPPSELPDLIEAVLGAFASIIVQFVKGRFTSVTARFFLALGLSAIVGGASYLVATPAESNPVVLVIHVFAYSQLAYAAFWKVIWEEIFNLKKFGARRVRNL